MSKYRLELKCGGKLLGRWEIGDEPLDLSLSQDNMECLYFRLGTNDRVEKESQQQFQEGNTKKRFDHNVESRKLFSEFDGADMDTFAPSEEIWKQSNHFFEEESVSDQDDFTLPLPDAAIDQSPSLDATLPRKRNVGKNTQEEEQNVDANGVLSKDSSLLKRTLPREIYLSESFRQQLDEDVPAVDEDDDGVSVLDEFQLPSLDDNTLDGIPELSEDILDSSHLISSSLFSSLRKSSSSFDIGKRLIQGSQNNEVSEDSLQDSLSQGLETILDDISISSLQGSSPIIDDFEKDFDTIEQKFDWDDDFLGNNMLDSDEDQDTLILSRNEKSNDMPQSSNENDFLREQLFESRTNWGYLNNSDEKPKNVDSDLEENPVDSSTPKESNFNIELNTKEQPKRPKRMASEIFGAQKRVISLNHSSNLSLLTEGPLPEPQGYVPMEVWEFENNSWRMIGELTRGKKTTLLGLTTSHHRDGRISISGISEAEVILVDEAGNETIYVPDMSEDISAGTTILFRVDIDKICIRPSDDLD
jgi:hypothetical protein